MWAKQDLASWQGLEDAIGDLRLAVAEALSSGPSQVPASLAALCAKMGSPALRLPSDAVHAVCKAQAAAIAPPASERPEAEAPVVAAKTNEGAQSMHLAYASSFLRWV